MNKPPVFDISIEYLVNDLLRLVDKHALVYILSDDGTIEYTNSKLAEISKFTVDELVGSSIKKLRSSYHPDVFYKEIWDLLRRGETWSGELCGMCRAGTYFWEDLSIRPLSFKDDTKKYYLGVSTDITLLKNREQTMSAYNAMLVNTTKGVPLKENFDALINNIEVIFPYMTCAIMMLEDGKYLRSVSGPSLPNDYACAVDGLEIGEIVGSCGAAAKAQKLVVVEDLYNHPNWAPYIDVVKKTDFHACWSHPILSSSGETYGTFAIYYKTTRGPTPNELNLIQSLAYSCCGAIESDRARRELIEQKNRAEAASHAKDQFLANMSHELRTPLNAILGFSGILQQELFGPIGNDRYKGYSQDIEMSASFLLEIIEDILDISIIEAGKISLDPEVLSVSKLMENCMQLIMSRASEKEVVCQLIVPDPECFIFADEMHMKQILTNLLINAIKFTPKFGNVTFSTQIAKPEFIDIFVKDTGIGIASKDLEKVLEPFSQVEDSMTRSHEGVGLGLSLAKRLALVQGGELSLESELGRGTSVSVRLPLAK